MSTSSISAGVTPRLGLPKPADDADEWGDDYRRAMDYLDAHPGIAIVPDGVHPALGFDGQVILEKDSHRLLSYSLATNTWAPLLTTGPQGQAGAQGPTGPTGPPGPNSIELIYTQSVAAADWWIPHPFVRKPDVTLYDAEGDQIYGQVSTSTPGLVHVSFGVPMTGSAVLD